jgi:hypothetical protein
MAGNIAEVTSHDWTDPSTGKNYKGLAGGSWDTRPSGLREGVCHSLGIMYEDNPDTMRRSGVRCAASPLQ